MDKQETNIPIAVVNNSKSEITQYFTDRLEASEKVHIKKYYTNVKSAQYALEEGEVEGIVYFPKNFTSDIKRRKQTNIKLLLNTSRFLLSNSINLTINEIMIEFTHKTRREAFMRFGSSYKQADILKEPVELNTIRLNNVANTYGDYLIPLILILILQQTLLIATSESFAKENQEGTLFSLIKKAENKLLTILFGKGAVYLSIFTILATITFYYIFDFFGLYFKEITFTFLVAILIYFLSIIAMGFFFGSFLKKKVYVLQILVFSTYPLFFIAGVSYPLENQPTLYKYLAHLFPSTPFYQIFYEIGHFGANILEVWPQLLNLAGIGILSITFFYFRVWHLKKQLSKQIEKKEHFKP